MQRRAPARHANAALCAALIAIFAPLGAALAAAPPAAPVASPGLSEDQIAPAFRSSSEDDIPRASHAVPASGALQLLVMINEQPTNKIVGFKDLGGGRMASTRRDLEEIGIRPPGGGPPDEEIALESIPNLTFVFDEAAQQINLTANDDVRITVEYDARAPAERDAARADYGAVLNYTLFGVASTDGEEFAFPAFEGANATLDGRLFTPYGVLNQTVIVGERAEGLIGADDSGLLRLDTTFTHADEENLVMYRAGDVVSNGPYWSRPIRLGGLQVQRSFQLRPDLVKQALPSYSGSAAVPSTVDVYVNNAKAYSKEVGPGPYQINNIPTVSGAGIARVVVRDAAGRETEQNISFYSSPQLLRPGLIDFSVEGGLARHDYGLLSNNYDDEFIASGSIKAGVYEDVSVEGHAEGGDGLLNAGAGVILRAADYGVVSLAGSASTHDGDTGFQIYGSLDTRLGPVMINLRSQRAFQDYSDLAALTVDGQRVAVPGVIAPGGFLSLAPPRAVDQIGFNVPIDFDRSNFGVNFVHYESIDGEINNLITATYSRPLFKNATLFATGYTDIEDRDTAAIYVGVNMPLDDGVSVSAGAERRNGQMTAAVDASKSLDQNADSWGWRIHDREGGDEVYRSAEVSYRASSARVSGGVLQDRQGFRGTVTVEGAVATLGGGIYASNRINDAFAVVDAGAPGVRVLRENNYVGDTGEDGKLLVPNLNSYQRNKLEIDPSNLPVNAEVSETNSKVTPALQSGIYVDFQVKRNAANAIIILTDASGAFLPAGSDVFLDGSDQPFLVGYDGQAYITGLKDNNTLTVKLNDGDCHVSFAFTAQDNTQTTIGPEVCQ